MQGVGAAHTAGDRVRAQQQGRAVTPHEYAHGDSGAVATGRDVHEAGERDRRDAEPVEGDVRAALLAFREK